MIGKQIAAVGAGTIVVFTALTAGGRVIDSTWLKSRVLGSRSASLPSASDGLSSRPNAQSTTTHEGLGSSGPRQLIDLPDPQPLVSYSGSSSAAVATDKATSDDVESRSSSHGRDWVSSTSSAAFGGSFAGSGGWISANGAGKPAQGSGSGGHSDALDSNAPGSGTRVTASSNGGGGSSSGQSTASADTHQPAAANTGKPEKADTKPTVTLPTVVNTAGVPVGVTADAVTMATNPEPASIVLMTTGLLATAGMLRRRRR